MQKPERQTGGTADEQARGEKLISFSPKCPTEIALINHHLADNIANLHRSERAAVFAVKSIVAEQVNRIFRNLKRALVKNIPADRQQRHIIDVFPTDTVNALNNVFARLPDFRDHDIVS